MEELEEGGVVRDETGIAGDEEDVVVGACRVQDGGLRAN